MLEKEIKKYLIVFILIVLAYIAYLVIQPFITAILGSFVLAYLFYPIYKKIKEKTKNEILSAIITTVLAIIIILVPLVYISDAIISESLNLYRSGVIEKTIQKISEYTATDPIITQASHEIINKIVIYAKEQATTVIRGITSKVFDILITIYGIFAFLITGEEFIKTVKKIIPIKKKDELITHVGEVTYSIMYGLFITALIEVIISLIAFKIIGTHAALILALGIGFLAFIPFLGPSLIWVPYLILEILKGDHKNVIIIGILGITLFIIETFIRPKIIGDRVKLHPLLILIGTIGGIKLMGFIGLIIGPVVLSAIVIIIKEQYEEIENEI